MCGAPDNTIKGAGVNRRSRTGRCWSFVAVAALVTGGALVAPSSAQAAAPPPTTETLTPLTVAMQAQVRQHELALSHKPLVLQRGRLVDPADLSATSTSSSSPTRSLQSAGAVRTLATSGGAFTGVVTEAGTGSAIPDVCAEVYAASDVSTPVTSACSDATGHYTTGPVPNGQYVVQFVDGDTSRTDIPQWYNAKPDAASADLLVVNDADVSNVNAVMVAGGWVTGTVTDSTTGAPIAGACVSVWDPTVGNYAGGYDAGGYVGYSTCTDAAGVYRSAGLSTGSYQVVFDQWGSGSYLEQWYDGQPSADTATSVQVTLGSGTSNIDAALRVGGSIAGTVSDANGPVADASVQVYAATTGAFISGGWANTDSSGAYETQGLADGTYKVEFTAPSGSSDQGQWYRGMPDMVSADTVTIANGQSVTGVDATLTSGGSITGTVTDSGTSQPLEGICVQAISTSGQFYPPFPDDVCSDSVGAYTIDGLPDGDYQVEFHGTATGMGPDTSEYVSQTYPNLIGQSDAQPTFVHVTGGATVSGIDDAAVRGATFSGTVTDSVTGTPVSNVCVAPNDTTYSYYGFGALSCSDSSGHYTTPGVPTGSYLLQFTNPQGRYIEQWFDNQPDQSTAQPLSVVQGSDYPSNDAKMQLGGNVGGTVTAAVDGTALSGICVTLYQLDGSYGGDGGCTDAAGRFTSSAVAAGTYKVGFDDYSGSYASQYYNAKTTLDAADPVNVVTGQTTSGIDAALTALTVPGAPTGVTAAPGDGEATVQFSAPATDGGSEITEYVITPTPACPDCTGLTTLSLSSTVAGLTNGTAYTFTVSAVNAVGTGPASAPSAPVTPAASTGGGGVVAPGAPTNVRASANVSTVALEFTAPASDGGTAITGYTITPSPACPSCTGLSPSGTSSTVTGLTPGTTYTFTVKATNSVGTGSASLASNAVTPTAEAISPVSSTTTDPTVPATVTDNGTTATGSTGTGTLTVSRYPSNPAAAATFPSAGTFLDVSTSSGSTFTTVVIKDCNLHGGSSLQWWNPLLRAGAGAWAPVVGHPTDTTGLPGCLTVTLDASSSPSVSELGGTIFAVVASVSPPPPAPSAATVSRLAGPDRYATAAAISREQFPNGHAGAIVLAGGEEFPDALVAAPLAAARNASLLLTYGSTLPAVSKTELERVLPAGGTVYVLGGTGAVPATVASQITDLGYRVVRYGGADRFDTAVKVAHALGDPATVLLASGTDFPDALSAGVAAAKVGGAVLLTNGTAVTSATSAYLSAHGVTVYAVGGPAAQADSKATGLLGSDRYATAIAVANKFFTAPAGVGVASGVAFPDALSGGAFLAHAGVPLVLSGTSNVPAPVSAYVSSVKSSVTSAYVFGGTGALDDGVEAAVASALMP